MAKSCGAIEDWVRRSCSNKSLCGALAEFAPQTLSQMCRRRLHPQLFGRVGEDVSISDSAWDVCNQQVVRDAIDRDVASLRGGEDSCGGAALDAAIADGCGWCQERSFFCSDHAAALGQRCLQTPRDSSLPSQDKGGPVVFTDSLACERACGRPSMWRRLQWPPETLLRDVHETLSPLPVRHGVGCLDEESKKKGWEDLGAAGAISVPCDAKGAGDIDIA